MKKKTAIDALNETLSTKLIYPNCVYWEAWDDLIVEEPKDGIEVHLRETDSPKTVQKKVSKAFNKRRKSNAPRSKTASRKTKKGLQSKKTR